MIENRHDARKNPGRNALIPFPFVSESGEIERLHPVGFQLKIVYIRSAGIQFFMDIINCLKVLDYDAIWSDLYDKWPKLAAGEILTGKCYLERGSTDVAPAVQGWAREQGVMVHFDPPDIWWIVKPGGAVGRRRMWEVDVRVPHDHAFNPGLERDPETGRLVMAFRTTCGGWRNGRIWIAELDETTGQLRSNPDMLGIGRANLNYEDPRLFVFRNRLWLHFTILEFGDPLRYQMAVAPLGRDEAGYWELTDAVTILPSPSGQPMEKNWIFFEHEGDLCFVWACDPWTVLRWRPEDEGRPMSILAQGPELKWNYGHIRGTSPFLKAPNGKLWAFFHSNDQGRYVTGLVEADPVSLQPVRMTGDPLFPGEPEDPGWFGVPTFWLAGAVIKGEDLLMACGISNHSCWLRLERIDEIESALQTIENGKVVNMSKNTC